VGGVRELVGDAGVIVPSRCADQLASAMLSAMRRSSGDRLAFGRAARDRVVGEFGMDANADQWEALYREFARQLPVVHN
jgi:glycosyltransferase involved in cell wall biosynthesis